MLFLSVCRSAETLNSNIDCFSHIPVEMELAVVEPRLLLWNVRRITMHFSFWYEGNDANCVIISRVNPVQSLAFNAPPFCFTAVPFRFCLFSCSEGEHVRKFPRSRIFLFLDLVQLFLQEKYSASVCFNGRIFVFYLLLLSKRSS